LGEVPHNAADSAYIVMFNDGQYPIKINNITSLPKGFRIRPEKNVIQPSEEVRIYASIDAYTINDFGPFNKTFRLITDDPEYNEKPLFLFGHIKYNFGRMSKKEIKASPKFSIDNTSKDFGEKQVGTEAFTTFKITNKGKNNLKILAVKAQCSCTEPSINKTELKNGESAVLTIKFDMLGHAGSIQKIITIYTNDPSKPTVDIMVKAKLY